MKLVLYDLAPNVTWFFLSFNQANHFVYSYIMQ